MMRLTRVRAGDDESYDFGKGAGFYVDATTDPWKRHYNMFTYIKDELPALVHRLFNVGAESIMGHSMGGHGALILALRQPGRYATVSAFAPICHPTNCDWGRKAFNGYLGPDRESWKQYDACELVRTYK